MREVRRVPPRLVAFLDRVTAQGESGGRDYYAGGGAVLSPKGAKFAMQVMPDTARDPGFGLAAADPNNPSDMNRLGREYRAVMQQKYGGNLGKMWAAYNMGPNGLDSVIERHGADWFQHVPEETRQYVLRNLRAVGRR